LFFKWQQSHGISPRLPIPSQESILLLYLAYLSLRLSYSSIKKTVSSIGFAYKLLGLEDTFAAFHTTRRLLKGIKRTLGSKSTSKQAILPGQLNKFRGDLQGRTIAALAFYGLLRISEALSIHTGDIQLVENGTTLVLTIRSSKTDPHRLGAQVSISEVSLNFENCPVQLLKEYLEFAKPEGKLFTWSRQKFVSL
jgi:hypothetical protein